jgi:ATP-binding cassette subfamily C protein CydD
MLAVEASEAIKLDLRRRLFGAMLHKLPVWTGARSSGALSILVLEQVEALDGFFVRYLPAMIQAAALPMAFAAVVLPLDWVVGLISRHRALDPGVHDAGGLGRRGGVESPGARPWPIDGPLRRPAARHGDPETFRAEEAETEAMFEAGEQLRRRSMKVMRIAFLSSAVLEFFAALGVASVALYCGLSLLGLVHLRATPLSLEIALFCLLVALEVYQPLRLLAAHYHDRAAAKAALGEIEAAVGSWQRRGQRPLARSCLQPPRAPCRPHCAG